MTKEITYLKNIIKEVKIMTQKESSKSYKEIIIYYSLTGNTRYIAEKIKEHKKADIIEIKPIDDIKKKGFLRYLKAGRQVIKKEKPKLKEDIDLKGYDKIYIGTPVWAGSFVPAIRTFIESHDFKDKEIGLFCTYKGNESRTFKELKDIIRCKKIMFEQGFKDPLKYKEQAEEKLKKIFS